tara:strand:+ start:170 stop:532 length:363 start_codon:yes stop_codon:yes gene_type:complete
MYNIDFLCNYKLNDSDEEYQSEFLKALQLNEWDEKIVQKKINYLFDLMKSETFFQRLINKIKSVTQYGFIINLNQEEENEIAFRFLFSYDYFDLMHACVVDYIKNKKLNPILLNNLLNKI